MDTEHHFQADNLSSCFDKWQATNAQLTDDRQFLDGARQAFPTETLNSLYNKNWDEYYDFLYSQTSHLDKFSRNSRWLGLILDLDNFVRAFVDGDADCYDRIKGKEMDIVINFLRGNPPFVVHVDDEKPQETTPTVGKVRNKAIIREELKKNFRFGSGVVTDTAKLASLRCELRRHPDVDESDIKFIKSYTEY